MKIGPHPSGVRVEPTPPQGAPGTDSVRSSVDPVVSPEPVVKVTLSGSAKAGQSAEPPLDSAKVAEMKKALAEGRFPFDARKVAEGLLAHVREMMERTKPTE